MSTDYTNDVFISYSSSNDIFAELLRMKLAEAKISIWKDTEKIRPSEEWRNVIDFGLENSNIVLVLLDKAAAVSPYVTYEWSFALGNGKSIVPVLLEDCEVHPRINGLQYLDFRSKEKQWGMLVDIINVLKKERSENQVQNIRVKKSKMDEIDEIVNIIKSAISIENFIDIDKNIDMLEVFYKFRIADYQKYYSDILDAFISVFGLPYMSKITVNNLILWDIEIMTAKYNMLHYVMSQDKDADGKELLYRYFKADNDDLNYRNWKFLLGDSKGKLLKLKDYIPEIKAQINILYNKLSYNFK